MVCLYKQVVLLVAINGCRHCNSESKSAFVAPPHVHDLILLHMDSGVDPCAGWSPRRHWELECHEQCVLSWSRDGGATHASGLSGQSDVHGAEPKYYRAPRGLELMF